MLELIYVPDKRLMEPSDRIMEIDQSIRDLAAGMIEVMRAKNGAGLAAVQVGIPVRLIVVDTEKGPIAMVNPSVEASSNNEM